MKSFNQFLSESVTINGDFNGTLNIGGTPQQETVGEQFVADVLELAVIVAVDQMGNMVTYPSIEMYFNPKSNLVEFLYSPAQVSEEIEIQSREIRTPTISSTL